MKPRYLFCLGGGLLALLGVAFRVIDGGSILASGVCAAGVILAVVGVVPDLVNGASEVAEALKRVRLNEETLERNREIVSNFKAAWLRVARKAMVVLLAVVGVAVGTSVMVAVATTVGRTVWNSSEGDGAGTSTGVRSSRVRRFSVTAGDVVVTHKPVGLNHIQIKCNNGLVIDSDWQLNAASEYGYDLYDVDVSRDYNKVAVFITLRGILAAYLRGEYD